MSKSHFHVVKLLIIISITLLSLSTSVYAKSFDSPCFSIALENNLNLISKTEEKNNGFYRYVFASSNNEDAEQQMRVIVSSKTTCGIY